MRDLVYYIGASLDGYIAGPGGEFDFFPQGEGQQLADYHAWLAAEFPDTIPTFARPHLGLADAPAQAFDTVLMGLGTYRPVPDSPASPYAHLRQYVVSTTLGRADDPAVTVVDADPLAFVRDLKREEGLDIWLCGGGKLAGTLLPEIDRLVVKRYPVVAGGGVPLFDGPFAPTRFTPDRTHTFDTGVRVTWYTSC
ncbi:dihydrofolate reductase family protein [Actinomadura atramentaria]|uniref:dihydrofolate reductase family protein n=1 Tax=Actinomadura atramentaria TaxID=1990 RepID=UPI00036357BC|nr:dihydrofolate reductase family protein [Actinomadura atramentaria]